MARLPEPTTGDAAPQEPLRAAPEDFTRTGRVVAHRYELIEAIGQGGFGTVWSALDRLSGARVAVKFWNVRAAAPARIRREVAALRLLRVPGVVQLLDEGRDGREAFLVMEHIEGKRFPGVGTPAPWEAVADTVVALLETLARVHAYGVVHRDLKPSNVLVDARGRPTVLDFGVARTDADPSITTRGQALGTPAYLAPEQLANEPVGPATDLYALGTMLFEALAGELPFGQLPLMAAMYARAFRRAPSLSEVAPSVPSHVAEVVDAMLRRSPADRPRSAGEALERLRGGQSIAPADALPRLRDEALLREVLERVRGGRSVDVVGPRDSGHAQCIREAGRCLAAEGRTVLHAVSARAPFASLAPVVGRPEPSEALSAVERWVEGALHKLLSEGAVVTADDVDALDRWSREALARARTEGVVLRGFSSEEGASGDALHARPLDEAALRALFAGPDRVHHLQEDGARLLGERSGGCRLRVEREVHAWIRAGLARWDGALLVLRRDDLERIEVGLRAAPSNAGASWRTVPEHLRDLLAWVALAWPNASAPLLAEAMQVPRWEVDAGLEELELSHALLRGPDGRLTVEIPVVADELWPDDRCVEAHRALARALPPGAEGRLMHLVVAAGSGTASLQEVADEGVAAAHRHGAAGHLGRAEAVLRETLLELHRRGDEAPRGEHEATVLAAWVDVALAENTPHALDRVLYEITRARDPTPAHAAMEALVRAALPSRTNGEHALSLADALPPLEDARLDWWRQSVRVIAARRCSFEREEGVLDDVAAWADRLGTPEAQASLAAWRARLRYRQYRFDEAAELWLRAARDEVHPVRRLSAMTGASSALMEAARHGEAEAWALTALDAARSARHAYFEARAEWLVRATRYRQGHADDVDHELVDAVAAVGVGDLEALVCLNEAAVAWRLGRREDCIALARRVAELWSRSGWSWPLVLPRALALAARGRPDNADAASLARSAAECPAPSVGVQALALLALTAPVLRDELRPAVRAHAGQIARETWWARREIVSVAEALASVGDDPRP